MTAAKLKLVIEQGATFNKVITWKTGNPPLAVNLTGCTARMQIRETIQATNVLASLTTENGGITLGGSAGTITLLINAADTTLYAWTAGVWDIEIMTASGVVTRLLYGSVVVTPEVTR